MLGAIKGAQNQEPKKQQRHRPSNVKSTFVITAKAGIQSGEVRIPQPWIPAFEGMTVDEGVFAFDLPLTLAPSEAPSIAGHGDEAATAGEAGCRCLLRQAKDGLSKKPAMTEKHRAPTRSASSRVGAQAGACFL